MDEQPVSFMDSGGARRHAALPRASIDPRQRHSSHAHLFESLVVGREVERMKEWPDYS